MKMPKEWAELSKEELEAVQDQCDHLRFITGICEDCYWKCEHQESDKGHCLDCGEYLLKDIEPDDSYLMDQEREDHPRPEDVYGGKELL